MATTTAPNGSSRPPKRLEPEPADKHLELCQAQEYQLRARHGRMERPSAPLGLRGRKEEANGAGKVQEEAERRQVDA